MNCVVICEKSSGNLWIDTLDDAEDLQYFNQHQIGGIVETPFFIVAGLYSKEQAENRLQEIKEASSQLG